MSQRSAAPGRILALPLIAILLSLLVGSVVIIVSELAGHRRARPAADRGLRRAHRGRDRQSERAIVNTLVDTTPLLLGGLSVALGFKAGLFNIGAQGQFLMGALGAVIVGVAAARAARPSSRSRLSLAAGMLFGAFWGFIPGFLKAVSGAHEVVTTIMLNFIAIAILAVAGQRAARRRRARRRRSRADVGNAALPILLGRNGHARHHLSRRHGRRSYGWLLSRTTLGFEIRTVGANPDAARYAGMRRSA